MNQQKKFEEEDKIKKVKIGASDPKNPELNATGIDDLHLT